MGSIVQGTPIIPQGSSNLPPAAGFYSLENAQNPVLPGGRAQGGSIIQGTPFTLPEALDADADPAADPAAVTAAVAAATAATAAAAAAATAAAAAAAAAATAAAAAVTPTAVIVQPLVPISTFVGGGSITRGTPVNRTLPAGSGGEEEDMETDENETPPSMDQVLIFI